MGSAHYFIMDNNIYFTRPNKEKEASESEIKSLEKFRMSYLNRGKEVYIIEKFPKRFFYFATKIKLEKVAEPVSSLSALSNSRLFKVILTNNVYE